MWIIKTNKIKTKIERYNGQWFVGYIIKLKKTYGKIVYRKTLILAIKDILWTK